MSIADTVLLAVVLAVIYVASVLAAYWLGHTQGWTKGGRAMRPTTNQKKTGVGGLK